MERDIEPVLNEVDAAKRATLKRLVAGVFVAPVVASFGISGALGAVVVPPPPEGFCSNQYEGAPEEWLETCS